MCLAKTGGCSLGVLLLFAVLVPGCGSGQAGTYAEKCAAACKAPDKGPCAGQKEQACRDQCVAATDGLKVECAQCIAEHTGWYGSECTCAPGGGCTACGYNTYGDSVGCFPKTACAPEDTKCGGFAIGKASGSRCSAICGIK